MKVYLEPTSRSILGLKILQAYFIKRKHDSDILCVLGRHSLSVRGGERKTEGVRKTRGREKEIERKKERECVCVHYRVKY